MPTNFPKLSPARNQDIPRLPWLLVNFPENVLLRERWNNATTALIEVVCAPYFVTEEDGHFVFCAHDINTHELVSLRIVDSGHFTQVMHYTVSKKGQKVQFFETKDLMVPSHTAFTSRRLNDLAQTI